MTEWLHLHSLPLKVLSAGKDIPGIHCLGLRSWIRFDFKQSSFRKCYVFLGNSLSRKVATSCNTGSLSKSEVTQSCLTLCDPMDYSLQGSSVHGIFQARVLEWVAISFSRGSSRPRDRTQVSHIAGRHFTVWATREALYCIFSEISMAYLQKDSLQSMGCVLR